MSDFDPNRAAEHLDLYRADGRFYDLSEENGVLTLQLRRSASWERSALSAIIFFFGNALLVGAAAFGGGIAGTFFTPMEAERTWIFDKNVAKVRCNKREIADLPHVRGVRAWRRGSRFYIALKLRFGQSRKVGQFAFARSERAWRDDAAQIAAFLGVPLEIPPAI